MEIRFNENKTQVKKSTKMEKNLAVQYIIKDSIEGDVTIHISMGVDNNKKHSYTQYEIIDEHNGKITIYNAPDDLYVATKEPIYIGTYARDNKLYLKYMLEPMGIDRSRIISTEFYILD